MKRLDKREKILVFIVAVLLLLLLFNLLIFKPLREKFNSALREIERTQLAIRKYSQLRQHKDEIIKEQKQIERYLSLKGSDEEKMAQVMSKIEAEARKSGLSILDMNPTTGGSKVKSAPIIYRIQLRAEAEDMRKIIDFIYNLENADILLKIDKFNLSTKDESGKVLKIEATILGIALS